MRSFGDIKIVGRESFQSNRKERIVKLEKEKEKEKVLQVIQEIIMWLVVIESVIFVIIFDFCQQVFWVIL